MATVQQFQPLSNLPVKDNDLIFHEMYDQLFLYLFRSKQEFILSGCISDATVCSLGTRWYVVRCKTAFTVDQIMSMKGGRRFLDREHSTSRREDRQEPAHLKFLIPIDQTGLPSSSE